MASAGKGEATDASTRPGGRIETRWGWRVINAKRWECLVLLLVGGK
jgi:hypothetical protein